MKSSLEALYGSLLDQLGEDPEREGLLKTPHRAAEAMKFMTQGYKQSLDEVINDALFHEDGDDMVVVRNVEFFSLCEHHLLPFYGRAHIAYIPDGVIIGLSKIARITDLFARRLQVQERLTKQIAEAIQDILHPKGVGVVLEAKHLCMMARGVEKQCSDMVTSHVLGEFRDNPATRAEFMSMLDLRFR